MFELSVALKYLIPRKKQLSVSLIALLSVVVISLVVWLVLVFLSVTEGIERGWLQKLTTLNAPLRITPTHHYFSSYYYQIDTLSAHSHYSLKNIGEKAEAPQGDPYNPLEDGELPVRFPQPDRLADGRLNDPVKGVFNILSDLQKNRSEVVFQDFELSGALLRLQLLRPGHGIPGSESQGYLTQVSYLASLPDKCPELSSLLLPPTEKDLNHLLYLASHSTELSRQDSPALTLKTSTQTAQGRICSLLQQVKIKQLKTPTPFWQLPPSLLPLNKTFEGIVHDRNGTISHIDIPLEKGKVYTDTKIWKEKTNYVLEDRKGQRQKISLETPLLVDGPLLFNVEGVSDGDSPLFKVETLLQGISFKANIRLDDLEISKADFSSHNLLPVNEEKETGVLLAKSFLDQGVMIGDRGYLSYASTTSSSVQEHRLPIFVSGFYDPGVLSVGNKCILVPPFVARTINASSTSFNLDKTQSSGILVWFNDLDKAEEIKGEILTALKDQGLDKYWKVTSFRQYEFAKDLLEQFQSDKSLFALVGVIILVVACCNIISLLVLLVNDKKREIGILQAMGASRLSIAAIFGTCGIAMGILSSIIGTVAALFTMSHIDTIAQLLSFIQGHDAFNISFFGKSLPRELSPNAVTFILITTPFLSLLAGLVPAIKACRLQPSAILRSE
ncbi:MAG: FtsX-like permease family protein [Rhabdochlamydiaceae bacterium]